MLSKPFAGWITIKIRDWSDRASYLTDIHLDFLNELIKSYIEYSPACVGYDAEGWEGIIVIDKYYTYIIEDDTEPDEDKIKSKITTIEIDKDELAKELIKDIERDFEDWCDWTYWRDEEERQMLAEELRISLNKLKDIIEGRR